MRRSPAPHQAMSVVEDARRQSARSKRPPVKLRRRAAQDGYYSLTGGRNRRHRPYALVDDSEPHHGNPTRHSNMRELTRSSATRHQPRAGPALGTGWRPLIIAANYFYGSLHFIVTGGVMITFGSELSTIRSGGTRRGRDGLALIGFAFFPPVAAASAPLRALSTRWQRTSFGRSTGRVKDLEPVCAMPACTAWQWRAQRWCPG
jgi:hypothetical protein